MDTNTPTNYAVAHIEADDVGVVEFLSNQEGYECSYRQLTAGSYRGSATATLLNKTLLINERHSQSVIVNGVGPGDDYVLGVSLDAPAMIRFQGKQPSESDLLILKPHTSFHAVVQKDTDLVTIQLSQERIRTLCMAAEIDVETLDGETLPFDPGAMQRLRNVLTSAMNPPTFTDPLRLSTSSVAHEQRVLRALVHLLSTTNANNRASNRPTNTKATSILAQRVRDQLEASLEEPLQMLDLCADLQCKLRTLHYAFSSYFGEPPSAYHKKIRMNAARCALLDADPDDTTVTNIATQYGFWHLGRFAVDYKRLFGELPSQTLASTKPRFTYSSRRRSADAVNPAIPW